MKEWETKFVRDTSYINAAVNTAIVNANRKKGKPPIQMWKQKPKKGYKAEAKEQFAIVKKMEKERGKTWVQKIYKENHLNYQKEVIRKAQRKAKKRK